MNLADPPISSLLVVDDSPVQRNYTLELGRALGITELTQAGDGLQALQMLREAETPPALMIVDLEMPAMDGVELLQQMCEHRISVPFVVASSREGALVTAVEEMARVLGLPVLGAVRKPLTKETLAGVFDACRRHAEAPKADGARGAMPVDVTELHQAIESRTIIPYFQPKVDLKSGLLRGIEVLARWPHPRAGFIPPDRFIAAAEQQGAPTIHAITRIIFDQALAQAAQWNARGLKLTLAINLSPLLLDAPSLVDELCVLAAQHGIEPQQVVLEITESSVPRTPGVALGVLARLRMKGFGLSIDDYGTGFSSMQQLTRVSFTELKIDRSFVDGAHRHESRRVILESAIAMASRLNLTTVAEGVETMEDWRLLQQFGCSIGQGYLIARPMPGADVPAWLKSHRHRIPDLRKD